MYKISLFRAPGVETTLLARGHRALVGIARAWSLGILGGGVQVGPCVRRESLNLLLRARGSLAVGERATVRSVVVGAATVRAPNL